MVHHCYGNTKIQVDRGEVPVFHTDGLTDAWRGGDRIGDAGQLAPDDIAVAALAVS
jgi:hypothetical protein